MSEPPPTMMCTYMGRCALQVCSLPWYLSLFTDPSRLDAAYRLPPHSRCRSSAPFNPRCPSLRFLLVDQLRYATRSKPRFCCSVFHHQPSIVSHDHHLLRPSTCTLSSLFHFGVHLPSVRHHGFHQVHDSTPARAALQNPRTIFDMSYESTSQKAKHRFQEVGHYTSQR